MIKILIAEEIEENLSKELAEEFYQKYSFSFNLVEKHVSQISGGDTIVFDGAFKTVCSKDVKEDQLMGKTVFGDSFNIGAKPVLALWPKKQLLYENIQ